MAHLAVCNHVGRVYGQQQILSEPRPASWVKDAELVDFSFTDEKQGWAVGAQGVILKTTDGGETWSELARANPMQRNSVDLERKLQNLQAGRRTETTGLTNDADRIQSIRCRFESIHFADAQHGWIAGGYSVPYIDRSRSVILKTEDGGNSWRPIQGLTLPRIRKIHFHNARSGWAIGDSGNLYSSGFYRTDDGGNSWSAESQAKTSGCLAAAPSEIGLCTIDVFGRLGFWKGSKHQLSVLIDVSQDPVEPVFRDLLMLDQKNGVAVGDQGTIARTSDSGRSWQALNFKNAHPELSQVDLSTVTLQDSQLWFAGSPGNQLFSLDLQQGKVNTYSIPIQTSINRIQFSSSTNGIAIGDHGVILRTVNGGKSWKRVHGDSAGTAMLVVCESASDAPLAMLAKYATESNRICDLVVLESNQVAFERLRQATSRLGVSSCRLLQISSPYNAKSDDTLARARQGLRLKKLAQQIRMRRPNIVVSFADSTAATHHQQVENAVLLAARRSLASNPESPGGAPFQVQRLLTRDPLGPITVSPEQMLPGHGQTVMSTIALSRALLGQSTVSQSSPRYQIQFLEGSSRLKPSDIFSGLGNAKRIPTRRSPGGVRANLVKIKQANHQNKRMRELLAFEIHHADDIQVWRRQIDQELMSMEPTVAATWLVQLFEGYHQSGKLELASQTAQRLAIRWSDSPYSLAALVWLANHYASEEQSTRLIQLGIKTGRLTKNRASKLAQSQPQKLGSRATLKVENGLSKTTWQPVQPPVRASKGRVAQATYEESEANNDADPSSENQPELLAINRVELMQQRLRLASRFLSAANQFDPDLATSPWYLWMEIQLSRRTGTPLSSLKNQLNNLAKLESANATTQDSFLMRTRYAELAKRELGYLQGAFLTDVNRVPADPQSEIKMSQDCLFTSQPPLLDGKLDESFWKLKQQSGAGGTVQFARDDDFLYLAIRCRKIEGANYQWQKTPRPTDADLNRRDRIALTLDVDRDDRTAFRLEVDHRGWVNDACNDDRGWDPDWYVAQGDSESEWTIEAAIPWTELVIEPNDLDEPWAVRLERLTGPRDSQAPAPLQTSTTNRPAYDWLTFPKAVRKNR